MHTPYDGKTGQGNAPVAIAWVYRGYTIEVSSRYDYRIEKLNDTDSVAGIWSAQTFLKAQKLVRGLVKGEAIRSSRAYRKGEVTEAQRRIANGEVK